MNKDKKTIKMDNDIITNKELLYLGYVTEATETVLEKVTEDAIAELADLTIRYAIASLLISKMKTVHGETTEKDPVFITGAACDELLRKVGINVRELIKNA